MKVNKQFFFSKKEFIPTHGNTAFYIVYFLVLGVTEDDNIFSLRSWSLNEVTVSVKIR